MRKQEPGEKMENCSLIPPGGMLRKELFSPAKCKHSVVEALPVDSLYTKQLSQENSFATAWLTRNISYC